MVYLKLLDPEEYLRYLNSDEREKYEYCCEWDGGAYGGMYECDTACLLIYDAVMARDYPLLQGAFLMLTITVLSAMFILDIIYAFLDPRIRRG